MRWAFRFGSVASGLAIAASLSVPAAAQGEMDSQFYALTMAHKACALALADKLAASKETADIVARAALNGCQPERGRVRQYVGQQVRGYDSAEALMRYYDEKAYNEVLLSLVEKRSASRR